MGLFLRKFLIAATGLFLCLFLVVHLSANALLLLPEATARPLYNAYSDFLRHHPLVQVVAYVLYAAILAHVALAAVITWRNRKAKGRGNRANRVLESSTWASQNMGLVGVAILLFLVVHLGQFWARVKLGIGATVGLDAQGHKDLYAITAELFANPWYVAFYAVLMVPLGLHLHHGFRSAFMSLGFHHRRGMVLLARIGLVYAVLVSLGFGLIPIILYIR